MFEESIKELERLNRGTTKNIDVKDLKEVCLIESFLLCCYEKFAISDIKMVQVILKKFHKCGRSEFDYQDFLIDNVVYNYNKFTSLKTFKKYFNLYESLDDTFKLLSIKNERVSPKQGYKKSKRYKEYSSLWVTKHVNLGMDINFAPNISQYTFRRKETIYEIDLNGVLIDSAEYYPKIKPKKGDKIEFTFKELAYLAKEMDEKLSIAGEKSENYFSRFDRMTIKKVKQGKITKNSIIKVDNIAYILGMVGSGKSTLMHILTYGTIKKGNRATLVLETITDVHKVAQIFKILGFSTAVVTGRTTILQQMKKLKEEGDMFLTQECAPYYTAPCPIQGAIKNYRHLERIEFGSEPCYSLEHNNAKYICPVYFNCPRKAQHLKIAHADVIITTTHSLVYGRTPLLEGGISMPLLDFILNYIDLVMIDEVDKVQVTLDDIFSKKYELYNLVSDNYDTWSYWNHPKNQKRKTKKIRCLLDAYDDFKKYYDKLHYFLSDGTNTKIENLLKCETCLTDKIIIEKFVDDLKLKEDLLNYSNLSNLVSIEENAILANYENSLLGTAENIRECFNQVRKHYVNSKVSELEFEFVFLFLCLDKTVKSFIRSAELLEYEDKAQLKLPYITRNPLQSIMHLIPEALLKHIFGYIYDKEKMDFTVFRQFGLGRSILLDLPFMKLNEKGEALGPQTILFSGTSYAPGSYRYHIERDVTYILEPREEIQQFIRKSSLTIIPTNVKVSGVNDKDDALSEIVIACQQYIQSELDKNHRILLIVNSYEQCKPVQAIINEIWRSVECYSLIEDDKEEQVGFVKRGNIERLRLIAPACQILIAPATSIERGFNIVGEDGHSLFNSLFFLVRPMEVPKDISRTMIQINGLAYSWIKKVNQEQEELDIVDLRGLVNQFWKDALADYYEVGSMPEQLKSEIVISRFILIMQIFGRLLRITNFEKTPPHIYFADDAFIKSGTSNFDLLQEICKYLERLLDSDEDKELSHLLYLPFYTALKKGLNGYE